MAEQSRKFKGNAPKDAACLIAIYPAPPYWRLYGRSIIRGGKHGPAARFYNVKLVAGEPTEGKANYWLSVAEGISKRYLHIWEGPGFKDALQLRHDDRDLYTWVESAMFLAEDFFNNEPGMSPGAIGREMYESVKGERAPEPQGAGPETGIEDMLE